MNKYLVDDIFFSYNYDLDERFNKNLSKYKTKNNNTPNHSIKVIVKDNIENSLNKTKSFSYKDDFNITHIYTISNNNITSHITHDNKYQNIYINVNKSVIKDLNRAVYILSGIMFLEIAIYNNYFPLHATSITLNNKTYLISAPSGTGKSTIRKNFLKLYNATIINDDKPLLKFINNEVYVVGSPFSGEDMINDNMNTKLSGIIFLNRGSNNKLESINKKDFINLLIKNTYRTKSKDAFNQMIKHTELLVDNIPAMKFYATKDTSAAKHLYNKLYKGVENLCK